MERVRRGPARAFGGDAKMLAPRLGPRRTILFERGAAICTDPNPVTALTLGRGENATAPQARVIRYARD
jgi:hypothetical protein